MFEMVTLKKAELKRGHPDLSVLSLPSCGRSVTDRLSPRIKRVFSVYRLLLKKERVDDDRTVSRKPKP